MTGKSLLHRDIDLCKWWVSISHDPRFDAVIGHVKAELADSSNTWDMLKGGTAALNLLATITDNPEESQVFPNAGLDYRSLDEISKRHGMTPIQPKE